MWRKIKSQLNAAPPEQPVALLVGVGLQLCHRLVLLDEFEELGGVQLGIAAVKLLQRHGLYVDVYRLVSVYYFIVDQQFR